jgi:phosphatidylserine/phosphatidylglycerophosphate/cardiolipin synthase-like enzyme
MWGGMTSLFDPLHPQAFWMRLERIRPGFLTSANLTEAALERNMELGALIRGGPLSGSIDRLIDALLESGGLHAV